MRILTLLIVLLLTFTGLHAQVRLPEGVYMSTEELLAGTPSQNYNLEIKQLNDVDYRVKSADKTIKNKVINKQIWAISTGEKLYLNGYHIAFPKKYLMVEHIGKYILYQGGLEAGDGAAIAFGGGALGAGLAGMSRWLYAWDPVEEKNHKVNENFLKKWLKPYPALSQDYMFEPQSRDMEVLIHYATQVNEKESTRDLD